MIAAILSRVPAWAWQALAAVLLLAVAWLHGRSVGLGAALESSEMRADKSASAVVERVATVRAVEATAASGMSTIVSDLKKENSANEKDHLIAELRAGTVRLREQLAARDRQPVSAASAAGSGADDSGGAELQPATGAALYEITRDADAVARRLGACQRALIVQQQACNGG